MSLIVNSCALYWDLENIHASLVDQKYGQGTYAANRFRPQEALIDIPAIVEFALSFGPLAINRAFANWASFTRYKQALLESAIELIQVFPPGANAKNGADIKLCLDVMEDMVRFPHITTMIVVGGDSDYMPLSYKVKAAGRTLVGIGLRRTTNVHWARSCHDFQYYEALLDELQAAALPTDAETPAPAGASDASMQQATDGNSAGAAGALPGTEASTPALGCEQEGSDPQVIADNTVDGDEVSLTPAQEAIRRQQAARELVTRAISRLAKSRSETWIQKARLRPYIKRLEPSFHESTYGFTTFNELVASMYDLVEVRKGEFDHELRLREGYASGHSS